MHERHAGRDMLGGAALDAVVPVGREALALDVLLRPVDGQVDRDDRHQRLALVLSDALPRDEVDLLEGIGQPVVIAEEVEVVVLVVEIAHLLAGLDLFFL